MTDRNGARSSSKRETFCVHCGCNVSKSTFYHHRAEFSEDDVATLSASHLFKSRYDIIITYVYT